MENKHVKVSIGDAVKIEIPLIGDGKLVKIVEVFDIQGDTIHFTYMNGSGMCNIRSVVGNNTLDYKMISLTRQNKFKCLKDKFATLDGVFEFTRLNPHLSFILDNKGGSTVYKYTVEHYGGKDFDVETILTDDNLSEYRMDIVRELYKRDDFDDGVL